MNTEESVKGYFALVFDEPSVAKLRALAVHERIHCHHVTLVFLPGAELYPKYEALKGRPVTCTVRGIRQDKKGQAGVVEGVVCDKENLHVTISCHADITPGYCNVLIRERRGQYSPLSMELSGSVEFIPLERQ